MHWSYISCVIPTELVTAQHYSYVFVRKGSLISILCTINGSADPFLSPSNIGIIGIRKSIV